MFNFIAMLAGAVALIVAGVPLILMLTIIVYGRRRSPRSADAAIVLGASVRGAEPSPVFRERINHGIALWRAGRVRFVLLTGGWASAERPAEAEVARNYALSQGVPDSAILMETQSRTTFENMVHARKVLDEHKLQTALIVSDPLHMWRAMRMARANGIAASPSPTPTTRYISPRKRIKFLWKELWANVYYVMLGY